MQRIRVIDTHTGGEPTRVVISSPLQVLGDDMPARCDYFRSVHDAYRRAIVCEPRGHDVMVGALLTPPVSQGSLAGVIFFNNVGPLGMCGHGLIGVVAALQFLEGVAPGSHRIDTPVGTVAFTLSATGGVRLQNVPSYRYLADVCLTLPDGRRVHGDVAWGGNWFFICDDHQERVAVSNLPRLLSVAQAIRQSLAAHAVTGVDAAEIDHVELIGPPSDPAYAEAKNFVLCPGGAYDRSPCGTGTSAKLACLAARGQLAPETVFRQESIIGSIFRGSYRPLDGGRVESYIEGQAFVVGEGELLLDPRDPFCMGILT